MSLRTRLVISFTVLLVVVIAAVGIVASRSLEGILVAQIDRTLVGFANRGPAPSFEFGFAGQQPPEEAADFLVPVAEMVVDGDGSVLFSRPSGFQDDPDPLPDVSDIPDIKEPFTIPAVDSSLEYRAIATKLPEELTDPLQITLVRAAPLTSVDEATNSLIRSLLIAGAAVLVLGGVATWWTVKRAMRPVDQMVDTAEAIASGDLSQRVPLLEPGTELGDLVLLSM